MAVSVRFVCLSCVALLIAAGGCSSKKTEDGSSNEAAALREVEAMLRMPAPPMTPNGPDLRGFQNDFPLACQAITSGEVIVAWGVRMPDEGEKSSSQEIVACEKKAPTEGGYVLLMNGAIKKITASEFQAAPKAFK